MPPTLAEVVQRAAQICAPVAEDDGVVQFLTRFEDRDEPVTAIGDVEQEILEGKGAIDPQDEDAAVMMAAAVAVYLAHRRDAMGAAPEETLLLAARAEFDGRPPDHIEAWLAEQGVAL